MNFEIIPALSLMEKIYEMPLSPMRFKAYLDLLQGDSKTDLLVPVGGYNPMAKDHVQEKLQELKSINAEGIILNPLSNIRHLKEYDVQEPIQVAINLADDLKGGWTNKCTVDYDSKFKINALVNRNFCTPYFWVSETYTEDMIIQRTLEYAYRTIYWKNHGRISTLEDHFQQEVFVTKNLNVGSQEIDQRNSDKLNEIFEKHKHSDNYALIFNFFYGDKASELLGYKSYGIKEINGFHLANQMV